jgi:ribosome-associated protein
LAALATQAAEERKATDVLLLDLRGLTLIADFFLIASGASHRQVRAIAENIEESLSKAGMRLLHREGFESARWVLLDFGDIVCHVFNPADREFFGLERFWGDAPRVPTDGRPSP